MKHYPIFDETGHLQKTRLMDRLPAKAADLLISFIVAVGFVYPLGPIFGVLYLALCDGFFEGQSPGKRLLGLRAVNIETQEPVSYKQSAIRNLPLVIPMVFGLIPVWGWIFVVLIGLPILLLEVSLIWKISSGLRLGDVMADSQVIQGPGVLKKWVDETFDRKSS